VISLLSEQRGVKDLGGTMRLGSYPCRLRPGTRTAMTYGVEMVAERHRHRYEFNNAYRATFEAAGLVASGLSPDGSLVEISELRDHPFMVGSQFHPELRSRPTAPHPLFRAFIAAAVGRGPWAAGTRPAVEESAVGSGRA
jgi:CTP synthase